MISRNHFIGLFGRDRKGRRAILGILFCLSVCLVPGIGQASSVPYDKDGIYSATTDDNITIMLYRYRPEPAAQYRTNGTPVLLFTGIVENMNQYLACTPDIMQNSYGRMKMPDVIADWALVKDAHGNPLYANGKPMLEKYIQADNMKYYSLAHYLWLKGYDPWFANYRDTGRLNMRSGGDNKMTLNTLDTWATLDAPAAIAKVKQVTGKRLYIGGHSTAGLVCYAYLQGCYMDYDGQADKAAVYKAAADDGYQRHVKGDPLLAVARNMDVKGFVALDPAGRPPLPDFLNIAPIWCIMSSRLYLPMDELAQGLIQQLPADLIITFEDVLFGMINNLDEFLTIKGMEQNLFGYLDFWYIKDTDPYMGDFMARYAISGCSVRGFSQYMDNGLHDTTREFWMNGIENKGKVIGPKPDPGNDGYYYYSENMSRMSVPIIAILSDSGSLVEPLYVQEDIISKKTPSSLDISYRIKGTAHVDVVLGRQTPTEVFPKVGAWLDKVEAADKVNNSQTTGQPENIPDTDSSQAIADSSGGGSSGGGCFIASAMF